MRQERKTEERTTQTEGKEGREREKKIKSLTSMLGSKKLSLLIRTARSSLDD